MSELLYLHQASTDYVSNQYTHTDVSTCQMEQQFMECILILLLFLRIWHTIDDHSCLEFCISTKLSRIVCLINTNISISWHARYNYKLQKDLWFKRFFGNLFYMLHLLHLYLFFLHFGSFYTLFWPFKSELLCLQTFTNCVCNQYTHYYYYY